MTQIKKNIAGLAFAAGCLILATGCEKDNFASESTKNAGPIKVAVKASDLTTRTVAVTTSSLEASNGFVLDVWTNDSWYDLSTVTGHIGEPTGDIHDDPADYHYIDSDGKANVKYSATPIEITAGKHLSDPDYTEGWYIVDATGIETYNWITGPTETTTPPDYVFRLSFWARYPQDSEINGTLTVTDPAINATTETFTYKLPSSAGLDATRQNDLLFAYAAVVQEHDQHMAGKTPPYPTFPLPYSQDYVNLTFNHPLSMIRFCVSPDDGTFDVNLKIKSITINNVPNGGTCVFDGTKASVDAGMFTWTPSTTLASYRENYIASFKTAPSGWTASTLTSDPSKHVYTCDKAFMLIPHSPKFVSAGNSSNARVTIVFEDESLTEFTRTVDINPSGTSFAWKPGYYYTYRIKATKIGREVATMVYLDDWTNPYSLIPIF